MFRWMSEKYDGVRALWDGEHFFSRNFKELTIPDYIKLTIPKVPLDGEIWYAKFSCQDANISKGLEENAFMKA